MTGASSKNDAELIETAAKIRRSMEAWDAMTDKQRAAALEAAKTAIPAEAMRHLGYDIPESMPADLEPKGDH